VEKLFLCHLYAPAYIETHAAGRLAKMKRNRIQTHAASCNLCPRRCGVDRIEGRTGLCSHRPGGCGCQLQRPFRRRGTAYGPQAVQAPSFFTHCNLLCNFCQNYDISYKGLGAKTAPSELAKMMIALQKAGCHNINLVTPSHVVYPILAALEIAINDGLSVPLVYNTSAYDAVETLQLLDGIVDIYMPDFKFWDAAVAKQTCDAPDYPQKARQALKEMYKQVGDLTMDSAGLARRGLLVRHLVLPAGLSGTREIMRFIARDISKNTYVNIMPQYRPCGRATEIKALSYRLSSTDYKAALLAAKKEGITQLDRQGPAFLFM
jgi:putative pyruvate formate lyase activating enzyme